MWFSVFDRKRIKSVVIKEKIIFKYTHWSFLLQNRGLSRLIVKNALGLCTVLSCVHFPVGRSPFIPGARKTGILSGLKTIFSFVISLNLNHAHKKKETV